MTQTIDKAVYGPWAVITGASSGIGKEFARQLAISGIHLVLVARRQSALEQLATELADKYNIDYRIVTADLKRPDSIDSLISVTEGLEVGLLVSNAGTATPGRFFEMDEQVLMDNIHLNAIAHFRLVHHYGNALIARDRGGLLIVSAMGAPGGLPYMANDAASKAYALSLGRGLHAEYAKTGVHTTVILPGPTETPVLAQLGFDAVPIKAQSVEACVAEALAALKKNRPALVTGRLNRMMNTLTPTRISQMIMGRVLSNGLTKTKVGERQAASPVVI